MTIALEHLADGSVSDRNFLKLMALVPDSGGQTVGWRFGLGTLSWPGGSAYTATATVAHGLGKTPLIAVAIADLQSGAAPCVMHYVSLSATDVVWRGYAADDSSPAGATLKSFFWLVVG